MGKAGKVVLGLIIAVIAVVAISVVLVFQNLDGIIKQVIERVGTDVTGTPVRVADVKFSLSEGRGEIYGLTIANPPGYQPGNLFEMNEVAVQIEPASLTGPVIVIAEVLIDGARVNAEQKGSRTNIQDLLDSMKSGSEEPPPEESEGAADVRLMLEQFAFVNTATTVKTQQFGERDLTIPDIRLSDIGDRETGLTPQQLANQMVSAIVKQAEKAIVKYLEEQVKAAAKDAAKKQIDEQIDKNLSAEDKEKLEGIKNLFKKD